jgi:sugar/nucleoside kinase (ribokinase family)
MSLIVVGSVAYDGVTTPHGKVDRMLGGAATYIALSASYFTPVKIVAVVGDDFDQEDTDLLTSRNIDLAGLERVPGGKTFFWEGVYSADMNDRTTLRTDLNVFADFNPKLPESYRPEPYLLLGNIQPELQKSVRAQMGGVKLSGGDTMNYWINDHRATLLKTLAGVDLLLINDTETKLLAGTKNPVKAAHDVLAMGPKALVVKHGEYGATAFFGKDIFTGQTPHHPFRAPALPLTEVVDPTGAGDSFAGGFFGYIASQPELTPAVFKRAMFYGGVMGSFTVEKFGTERLQKLTREEIDARFELFRQLTHLD